MASLNCKPTVFVYLTIVIVFAASSASATPKKCNFQRKWQAEVVTKSPGYPDSSSKETRDEDLRVSINERSDGGKRTVRIADGNNGFMFDLKEDGSCTNRSWGGGPMVTGVPERAKFEKKEKYLGEYTAIWYYTTQTQMGPWVEKLWVRIRDCMVMKEGVYQEDGTLIFIKERENVVIPYTSNALKFDNTVCTSIEYKGY